MPRQYREPLVFLISMSRRSLSPFVPRMNSSAETYAIWRRNQHIGDVETLRGFRVASDEDAACFHVRPLPNVFSDLLLGPCTQMHRPVWAFVWCHKRTGPYVVCLPDGTHTVDVSDSNPSTFL